MNQVHKTPLTSIENVGPYLYLHTHFYPYEIFVDDLIVTFVYLC